MVQSLLKDGERLDDLQVAGYEIIQDPKRFCFGIDAVLLANYAKVKKGNRVLDLGTGTGIIPILMHAHSQQNRVSVIKEFVGLEIQKESADLAARSVEHNGICSQVHIVNGDIKEAVSLFGTASFDVVTCNPPYMVADRALTNDYEPKTIARHEVLCTLEDVVRSASSVLKMNGWFYMIHKPARIPEIIACMKQYHLEPKRMRLVHPYVDKEPTMVLMGALKGGKPEMRVAPPLIVYKEKGVYSDEIYDIYGE